MLTKSLPFVTLLGSAWNWKWNGGRGEELVEALHGYGRLGHYRIWRVINFCCLSTLKIICSANRIRQGQNPPPAPPPMPTPTHCVRMSVLFFMLCLPRRRRCHYVSCLATSTRIPIRHRHRILDLIIIHLPLAQRAKDI